QRWLSTSCRSDCRGRYRGRACDLIVLRDPARSGVPGRATRPGLGNTMLARLIAIVLPPLSFEEAPGASWAAAPRFIPCLARSPPTPRWSPPARSARPLTPSPTLTPSAAPLALRCPKPDEVSLAHHGIRFLDELERIGLCAQGRWTVAEQPE